MQPDRTAELTRLMRERILVLDGAMGTMIQQLKLGEADFRGPAACGQPFAPGPPINGSSNASSGMAAACLACCTGFNDPAATARSRAARR